MAGISLSISANASGATATLQGFEKNALGLAKRIQVGFAERIGHRLFDGLMRAAAAIPGAMKDAIDAGGKLSDQMARTGAAGEGLVILERALTNAGMSAERSVILLGQMQKAISGLNEENKSTAAAFAELGLSMDSLRAADPVAAMEAIGKAIAGIEDPAQRTAIAMRIFGKAGAEALVLFSERDAFARAAGQLGEMPAILAANAARLDEVSDRLGNLGTGLKQVGTAAAVGILPALEKLTATLASVDLTGFGRAIGAVISAVVKLWPTIVTLGMAMAGMKVASIVQAFIAKAAALKAATVAAQAHTGATTANSLALAKQANAAKMAAVAMGALAVAAIAAQIIMAQVMAQAAATDALAAGIERGNAALRQFNLADMQSAVASREEIAEKLAEIEAAKEELRAATEAQIGGTDSAEARDRLRADMEATLKILDGNAKKLERTTDEQLASNAAIREAAKAEAERAAALEKSAERYDEVKKKFAEAQAAAEKRRVESLPLRAQIDELNKAEALLRSTAAQDKTEAVERATQLLEIEGKRADLIAKVNKEEGERLAKLKEAAAEYSAEMAMLTAQIAGNDKLVGQLEREARVRERIAGLMRAGLDATTAQDRAEKMEQLMDRARAAEAGRVAGAILSDARDIMAGRDPSAGKRSKDLQDQLGIDAGQADAIAANEARLEAIKSLEDAKNGVAGGAGSLVASSMARIGGGSGEVLSAGLDYDRQIADLSRQQVQLLQEIAASSGNRIFEGS